MNEINNFDLYNTSKELTKEQLLALVKMYLAFEDAIGNRPTLARFAEWSKQFNGNSKRNAITRRFASAKEGSDGWFNVMKLLGRTAAKHPKYTLEQILEIGKNLYDELGRLPTAKDWTTKLSINILKGHFEREDYNLPKGGGVNRANYMMCVKYGIDVKPKPTEFNTKTYKYTGERLSKFGLDTEKLGLEYSPVNEQGVVVLFSKIHSMIGFPMMTYITQKDTPDCAATCNIDRREHEVFIEFKHETRKPYITPKQKKTIKEKADYLICWLDNNESLKRELKNVKFISLREILQDTEVVKKINKHFATPQQEPKTDVLLHPGEVISMELEARNIKTADFARMLQIQPGQLNEILKMKKSMDEATALKLEKALGISAEFWMSVQTEYNLAILRNS